MDYTTIINQSGTLTTVSSQDFSVEVGLIILLTLLCIIVYYKLSQLLGTILTIALGVLVLYYGSINETGIIFGVSGWVIISIGLTMTINYLFEPIKRTRKG